MFLRFKKLVLLIPFLGISLNNSAQVVLNAGGPGNTYELINSVFAPGYNAVEAPDQIGGTVDGTHPSFGRHIAEVFDTDLNKNVFEFYSHVAEDNDVSGGLVRQRVEIKTYASSPANLKGVLGETVIYKWRFKIPVGFQPSSTFSHIHQVKAVDGDDGDPIFTLTPRKGSPNKLELIYVKDDFSGTDKKVIVNLSLFEGVWVEATETIKIGEHGTYSISIVKVSDGATVLSYSNSDIQTIRSDNSFIRPKWGIYRSLANSSELRDESIRFSDISIKEIPRKIILKLDDFYSNNGTSTATPTLDYLVTKQIKAGIGFVSSKNDQTALSVYSSYLNSKNTNGEKLFEVWHHGYDHVNPEFEGTSYAYQKQHFDDADQSIKNNLRIQMKSFGAPFNHVDATTNTVIAENINYKVTMFNNPSPAISTGILNLNNRVNMENGTGKPDYNFFLTNYNIYKSSYTDFMVLQGHPGQWGTTQIAQFSQIIDFLISEGVEFITPYEYYLSLNPSVTIPSTTQTINFPSLPTKMKDDTDFDAGAISSSGLPVTYNSSNSSVATIVDGKIHIVGVGTAVITASQTGNNTYKSADYVSQTLAVYSLDYRSKSSGNWHTPATWQVRANDGTWSTATAVPSASNNVYIQNGHTITIDAAEAYCYDLNINATTAVTAQGMLVIAAAFNANVNGKIRAYTGVAVTSTADGDYIGTSTATLVASMITTNATGVLKFVGGTRNITNSGEWQGTATTNNAEFALDADAIGTLNTAIKFKTFTFSSGTVKTNSVLNIGTSSTSFNGILTIKNGAKLISSKSGTASGNQVFTYSNANRCGSIIIDDGGILELTGAAPAMDVTTFTNNGTVVYSGSTAQTLLTKANDPTSLTFFNYKNLEINNAAGVAAVANSNNTGNIISAGGTITLTDGLLTTGNLTVPSGTISIIRTEGSLSTALNGIANVTYDGSSAINTGVEFPSTINNLTLNNSAGVTLESSKTINGTFTLTNGILNIPATAVLYISSGNQIEGNFTTTNHIKTLSAGSNTGALRIGSFSSLRTFPVGSANYYLPVTLTPYSISDISVKVFEGATADAIPNGIALSSGQKADLVNAIYNISRNSGAGNYDITFSWDAALEGSNFSSFTDNQIGATQYISGAYGSFIGNGDNTTNTITLIGVSTFAPFLIGKANTLPVSLTSFTAQKQSVNVQLKWTTASEHNNSFFDIQKSIDGVQFFNIGKVNGAGNSNAFLDYYFTDKSPIFGANYYRLSQVDFDGKTSLSMPISVNMGLSNMSMQVFALSNSSNVNINISMVQASLGQLVIYNINGQKVFDQSVSLNKGDNSLLINMINADKGVFIATYNSGAQILKKKFIR